MSFHSKDTSNTRTKWIINNDILYLSCTSSVRICLCYGLYCLCHALTRTNLEQTSNSTWTALGEVYLRFVRVFEVYVNTWRVDAEIYETTCGTAADGG